MITLDLDQATEASLRGEAARRGISPEQCVVMALEVLARTQTATTGTPLPFYLTATQEEWEAELQSWIDSQDESIPPLPDEALRRENMYEDRI